MLNLIFQSNQNEKNSKPKASSSTSSSSSKTIKTNDTKENQKKCDTSDSNKRKSNCCSNKNAKSMPSIIAIATIIGSLLMGIVSIFCIIKVEQNAENLFQSFMQNKVFVSRVEKIVQNYVEQRYPVLVKTQQTTTGTTTSDSKSNFFSTDQHQHVQNERKNNFIRQKRSSSSNFNDDNVLLRPSDGLEPEVEFFNPKLRHELEKKDAEIMAKTKLKGAAPGGDQWVWLTSYSRIPYGAITGFCQATREYCPPGPPGVPGVPGAKGNRGDIGIPGPPGLDGREGKMGPRGPKGERGLPGPSGLDGRDGIPGEPGLDGIPGRAGVAGLEGPEGKMGPRGPKGERGMTGKDGETGPVGPPGPQGEPGIRGLTGPRGRSGKPGINGTPGTPGINAWKVKVNGTFSSDLLVPPSIIGADSSETTRPIIIYENEHLRLRCAATGTPKPEIEWRREDGHTINTGSWEASSMTGHTLNITHINREHMGAYRCMADNGIPPQANQTFYVEVHFAPMIVITNSMIYAANGTVATLECKVEAFPEPLRYWERSDGRLLEPTEKYQMETHTNGYKSVMRLNITITSNRDYGEYHCISKNEMSLARGTFHVEDRNPYVVKPLPELQSVQIYGNVAPPKKSMDDICGPPTTCPECPDPKDFKCKDAVVSLYDLVGNLQINPTGNLSYPGISNRTLNCELYAIGKPVFHKFSEEYYGSALKDPVSSIRNDEKYWCTKQNESYRLYEYANKAAYRNNAASKTYRLEHPFRGNAHVIYNGSFYYNERDTPRIIKFDIAMERQTASKELKGLDINGTHHLYTTDYNYVDLAVDDNGLWVIYGTQDSNHTIVTKLDANDLEIEYSWNISINHHKLGEMFIVCGVLYGIDSVTERTTKIRLALDLYQNRLLDVSLAFTNPFRTTTTVGYNHRNKELYSWDRGNQLTYPVRYHEIGLGYNATTSAERIDDLTSQLKTGHEVYHDT